MEIEFATTDLQDVCESEKMLKKKFGSAHSIKLKIRLSELRAAKNVSELVAGHPHPLKYKRLGQFSLRLWGPMRLIFESANNPIPIMPEGEVDWNNVTIIRILSIEDYHD